MGRDIRHRYDDPLDLVWETLLREIGASVERSDEVYAAWDGRGTLTLASTAHLDPDDCTAQLVFHEICHHLVEGPASWRRQDWGLFNEDDRDRVREHACHRLQAALADPYGLRTMLAPTTEHRAYYDGLPPNPLGPGDDPAIPLAVDGHVRATRGPLAAALARALAATRDLARVVAATAPADSLWSTFREPHPLGLPPGSDGATCEECAWFSEGGCLQVERPADPTWPACARFEPPLDATACTTCAACCREGFHLVPVEPDEACVARHGNLLSRDTHGLHLARPDGRCVALDQRSGGFTCRIYADRPRNCAELEPGGPHCLTARRRVGLSW